jgi:surface antigen
LIKWKKIHFVLIDLAKTVSAPSQATVHLAKMISRDLYYECLDEEDAWQFPIPNLVYKINMQTRYAAARATVAQYTHTVLIPKNTFSPYGNSDEDSDGPPPSPKKTDATERKLDKYLQVFIEALPHLVTLHYGFKLQASNEKGYCFCALAKCLSPWRK